MQTYHQTYSLDLDQQWFDDGSPQQRQQFICYFRSKPKTTGQHWDVHSGELRPRIGECIKVGVKVFKGHSQQDAKMHLDDLRFVETVAAEKGLGSHVRVVPTRVGKVDSVSYSIWISDCSKTVQKDELVLIQKLPFRGHIQQLYWCGDADDHHTLSDRCSRCQQRHPTLAALVDACASYSDGSSTISSLEGVLVDGVYHLTSAILRQRPAADCNDSVATTKEESQRSVWGDRQNHAGISDGRDCRAQVHLVPTAPQPEGLEQGVNLPVAFESPPSYTECEAYGLPVYQVNDPCPPPPYVTSGDDEIEQSSGAV